MALRPQIQYSQIPTSLQVSTPSFRVSGAQRVVLIVPSSGLHATSAQALNAQGAIALGQGITSDSFVPINKGDGSGVWAIAAIAGPFAQPLEGILNLAGFDEIRFVASSAGLMVRTLALITKV